MQVNQLMGVLEELYSIRQPVFIWGPPGIGKSQAIKQVAHKMNMDCRDLRLSTLDPVDLRGLPYLDNHQFMFAPLGTLPSQGNGILFLDELNSAPRAVQAAAYQLVLDRRVGDYCLPAGWWVIAAGNGELDRGVTNQMPTPLMNRLTHLSLEPDLENWTSWALTEGIHPYVIAFLRYKGQPDSFPGQKHGYFFHFDPTANRLGANKGFPTPRSWEFVSRMLPVLSENVRFEVIQGTVGHEAAIEFMAFLQFCEQLPDPAAILLNPVTEPVPCEVPAQYGVATALAGLMTRNNMHQAMAYLDRCIPEIQTLALCLAKARDPLVAKSKAFISWATKNSKVLV